MVFVLAWGGGDMIMENLTLLKIKLSVLWIIMGVTLYRCSFYYENSVEKVVGDIAAMDTPEGWLILALWWLIPLFMAFLSLTLKDSINRWTNIILGIVWTVLNIFHVYLHLGTLMAPTVHQLLIVGSTVVFAVLIVWYAWKWK
jgi:intracellular septation protein A